MTKRVTGSEPPLTQARLKELVEYNPDTGAFICIKKNNVRKVGDILGTVNKHGYLLLQIDGKTYPLQRLAFLYMLGYFPSKLVDHINRNTIDNRWCNLREATKEENNRNRKCLNRSITGVKGLSYKPGRFPRYQAHVTIGDKHITKSINLKGKVEEEVVKQLVDWLKETRESVHGEFARHV